MSKLVPKITIPEKLIFHAGDWAVFQLFTSKTPLWESLKLVKTDPEGKPLRPRQGELRALRVAWGVDVRRLARSPDYVRFAKENPEANTTLESQCAKRFTVEGIEAQWGKQAIDEDRRRLLARRASAARERREKGRKPWFGDADAEAQFARYMEQTHAAALEENELWDRLYGG